MSSSNITVWHYKSLKLALQEYKELKKLKYPRVHLSKVIK